MSSNRITYQNWIAEIGRDPEGRPYDASTGGFDDHDEGEMVRRKVSEAVRSLDDDEREYIERFYFMGQSNAAIAEASGRRLHRLEALRRRVFRKLRRKLARFAEDRYGIPSKPRPECPICASPRRGEMDKIIAAKKPSDTWKPVMQRLADEHGLHIGSPQVLIGHQRYH